MDYRPPKHVLIPADLFFDLYMLVSDLVNGKLDELDAQLEADELLPQMDEKLQAMQARYEYWQNRKKTEKEP